MEFDNLWEFDKPVSTVGVDVPAWIDKDITGADIAAIVQGGCSSGAYMPAVTYYEAKATMGSEGDNVLAYLEDAGFVPDGEHLAKESWAGISVYFLSAAVETWALSIAEALENGDYPEDDEDDDV